MQFAKKMVLVPYSMVENLSARDSTILSQNHAQQPTSNPSWNEQQLGTGVMEIEAGRAHLGQLDRELQAVMMSRAADDVKLKLYQKIMSGYRMAKADLDQPTTVAIKPSPAKPIDMESMVKEVPLKLRPSAKLLLKHMRQSNRIGWNDRGELVVDRQRLPLTSVRDLVTHFVSQSTAGERAEDAPDGYRHMVRALQETNVPITAIKNRFRKSDIIDDDNNQPMAAAEGDAGSDAERLHGARRGDTESEREADMEREEEEEFSTPSKRKRKRRGKQRGKGLGMLAAARLAKSSLGRPFRWELYKM